MRTWKLPALLLAGLGLFAGCGDDLFVPDYNNPSLEELENNPTPTAIVTAAQGLMIGARTGIANQAGYVAHLGILGRESYTFDNSDPRFIDEIAAGILDPGNGAFGGSGWAPRYANIRNANIILNALEKVTGFSSEDIEAIRGFAKTIQALDFLLVINMRDVNGAPIDVNRPLGEDPAPLVTKDEVFAHISSLLDEASTHLGQAGGTFPMRLSSGFDGFHDPASFQKFNRALKARVEVYRGNLDAALAALGQSFLDTGASLDLGVYHAFGSGSGDVTNGLFNPQIGAHPSVRTDAELKPDGSLDDRVARKTRILDTPLTSAQGISTNVGFTIYDDLDAPVPIIRNEELILLRAEVLIGLGRIDDAAADLNFIRVNSGGLAPRTDLNASNIVDELLKQRRFSLLFEGGHRWIDMRRYGRLAELPLARASDQVPSAFPIPTPECRARGKTPPCSVGS